MSRARKRTKVSRACLKCRDKKRKCNGCHPCSSCQKSELQCMYGPEVDEMNLNSLYNNVSSAKNEFENITSSLERIKNNYPCERDSLNPFLDRFQKMTDVSLKRLEAGLDLKKIEAFDGNKSLETFLLDKGTVQLNTFLEFNTANTTKPPISDYFGLYSPISLVSLEGGAWLIRKLISICSDTDMKKTIFLFLKYLDANATLSKAEKEASLLSPLDAYFKISGLEKKLHPLDYCLQLAFSMARGSSHQLHEDGLINQPIEQLKKLVMLMEYHQKKFEITYPWTGNLSIYLEEDFLISSLCYEFFERTIFVSMLDLSVLQSLLKFLALRYCRDFNLQIGKLVAATGRLALDLGLNRWEYNIGRDEASADLRRIVWWECYWWDKWYAVASGKNFFLADDLSLCLFPKQMAKLGVESSMGILELLRKCITEALDVASATMYGHILLAKLIEKVQKNIIYNRELTHYSSVSGRGILLHEEAMGILVKESEEVLEMFVLMDQVLSKYIIENMDNTDVFELYIHIQFVKTTCLKMIICQMIKVQRASQKHTTTEFDRSISIFKASSVKCVEDTLFAILKQNKSCIFFKFAWIIVALFNNMTERFIERPPTNVVYSLSLICCVAEKCFSTMGSQNLSTEIPSYKNLGRYSQMLFILARVCCLVLMKHQNLSFKVLRERLASIGGDCVNAFEKVMNLNAGIFTILKSSERTSCLREAILGYVKMNLSDFESELENNGGRRDHRLSQENIEKALDEFLLDLDFESIDALLHEDTSEDAVSERSSHKYCIE